MVHYMIFLLLFLMNCSYSLSSSPEIIWQDHDKKLSVVKINTIKEPVFKNLQVCYECEFSPITKTAMTMEGDYNQEELASHWSTHYDVYIFYSHDIPAGFAVVNHGSMIDQQSSVHDFGEFYITPLCRKKGYGKIFAHVLFKHYPGPWEVRQLPETEKTSRQFWLAVIAAIKHEQFNEIINLPQWPGFVQQFVIS